MSLEAASRVTTEFVLMADHSTVKLAPAATRAMFRVEPLSLVDCASGSGIGRPSVPTAEPMTIDTIAYYDGIAQVVFSASVRDPFSLEAGAGRPPGKGELRYGGSLIVNTRTTTVSFKGTVSVFPAFEALVEDERGVRSLFQLAPEAGTTILSLYDAQASRATRPVEVSVTLRSDTPSRN